MQMNAVRLVVVCVLLACAGSVLGYVWEYPSGEPIQKKADWPYGLTELLNSVTPVHGESFMSTDTFYYRGDTKAFNAFLKRYSGLKLPTHNLLISVSKGTKQRAGGVSVNYDWSVKVSSTEATRPGNKEHLPQVTISLFAGKVQRGKIVVPKNVVTRDARSKSVALESYPAFAIFLLADDKMNAQDVYTKLREVTPPQQKPSFTLDDLVLQPKPLLTMDDIEWYQWNEHVIKLKPGVYERLPKVRNVFGVPFIVVVSGRRIYAGGFWTSISSLMPRYPKIESDPLSHMKPGRDTIAIEEPVRIVADPRCDPAIKSAFEKAGKLRSFDSFRPDDAR